MQTIDYSPLNAMPKRKAFGFVPLTAWFIFFTIFGLVFIYQAIYPLVLVLFVGAVSLTLMEYRNWRQTQKKISLVFESFAHKNQWQYVPTRKVQNEERGSIFLYGYDKKISNILSGNYLGRSFSTYSYKFTVGSGRSRQDYKVQVLEMTLSRVLPHMVIDSLIDYGGYTGSVLPIVFDKSQRLELEGDFYKYFALYAPDKYGISALTVLAPDAMEALMKYAALCDIEIIDNKIYFLWPGHATTAESFKNMLTTVDGVMVKIGKKLDKSDIYAQASQKALHTDTQNGVRLKHNRFATLVTAAVIIGYSGVRLSVELLPPAWSLAVVAIILIGFLVVFVRAAIVQTRKARLREELQKRSF